MRVNNRLLVCDLAMRRGMYRLYMKCMDGINNWDLVDVSAPSVVGGHLFGEGAKASEWKTVLVPMAKNGHLWERRVAMLATFAAIRQDRFEPAIRMASILVDDTHDLMHKAVGWMLREVGNRDLAVEREFLSKHYKTMPRTMLRYAIERFPEALRKRYLHGKI